MQNGKEKLAKNLNIENLLYLMKSGYKLAEIADYFGADYQKLYRTVSAHKNGRLQVSASGTGLGFILNSFKQSVAERRQIVRQGKRKLVDAIEIAASTNIMNTLPSDFLLFCKNPRTGELYRLVAQPV